MPLNGAYGAETAAAFVAEERQPGQWFVRLALEGAVLDCVVPRFAARLAAAGVRGQPVTWQMARRAITYAHARTHEAPSRPLPSPSLEVRRDRAVDGVEPVCRLDHPTGSSTRRRWLRRSLPPVCPTQPTTATVTPGGPNNSATPEPRHPRDQRQRPPAWTSRRSSRGSTSRSVSRRPHSRTHRAVTTARR